MPEQDSRVAFALSIVLALAIPAAGCDGTMTTSDGGADAGDAAVDDDGSLPGDAGDGSADGAVGDASDDSSLSDASADADVDGGTRTGPFIMPDRSSCAGVDGTAARHCKVDIDDPANTSAMGYWEYLPPAYPARSGHPLIIFLHGLGEVGDGTDPGNNDNAGTDLNRVDNLGPPRLISRNDWPPAGVPTAPAELANAIVLSPQWRSNCHPGDVVGDFVEWAADNYPVDERRVYITGVSCGGIGTWNYLRVHFPVDAPLPAVIPAAVVPIAGDGRSAFNNAGCGIGRIPIWAVHGGDDTRVPTVGSTEPIENLNSMCTGADAPVDAQVTVFDGFAHVPALWDGTYDGRREIDIYSWMFSHTAP